MARAFRPRVSYKHRKVFSELEQQAGFPLGEPAVGRGSLHNWLPITAGPLTGKTVMRCISCGCLSTAPTKQCGDPVYDHLHIYPGIEPELWVGEERKWRRATGKRNRQARRGY